MAVKIMKAGRRAACVVAAVNTGSGVVLSIKSEGTAHDVVVYLTADEAAKLVSQATAPLGEADAGNILASFL